MLSGAAARRYSNLAGGLLRRGVRPMTFGWSACLRAGATACTTLSSNWYGQGRLVGLARSFGTHLTGTEFQVEQLDGEHEGTPAMETCGASASLGKLQNFSVPTGDFVFTMNRAKSKNALGKNMVQEVSAACYREDPCLTFLHCRYHHPDARGDERG